VIRIGLTGTIGAGKSTVGGLFEDWGAVRLDADELAREVVLPGSEGLAAIAAAWGDDVLADDGTLDRAALREIVFSDPAERRRLEDILHPVIDRLRRERTEQAASEGSAILVAEIPLLFEKDLGSEYDALVVVDAPEEIRRGRVCVGRGVSEESFRAISDAQWDGERKRAVADFVIVNDGTLRELERRARDVWEAIGARSDTERWWKLDLHMHTNASHDSLSSPEEVVRRAREIGLDRIAVTDHNEIAGALEAARIDPELVIVGEEVLTSEGLDLIGLFLDKHIPKGGSFKEVADEIHAQGGVVYLPHPFDSHRGASEDFLDGVADRVDLVEGFNARIHDPARNRKAMEWARQRGLPLGAGSDAHMAFEIGRGRVLMPPFSDAESFLRSASVSAIEGEASSYLVHLGSTWAKIHRRIFGSVGGKR
jgi:dephospho-CoA kinase